MLDVQTIIHVVFSYTWHFIYGATHKPRLSATGDRLGSLFVVTGHMICGYISSFHRRNTNICHRKTSLSQHFKKDKPNLTVTSKRLRKREELKKKKEKYIFK